MGRTVDAQYLNPATLSSRQGRGSISSALEEWLGRAASGLRDGRSGEEGIAEVWPPSLRSGLRPSPHHTYPPETLEAATHLRKRRPRPDTDAAEGSPRGLHSLMLAGSLASGRVSVASYVHDRTGVRICQEVARINPPYPDPGCRSMCFAGTVLRREACLRLGPLKRVRSPGPALPSDRSVSVIATREPTHAPSQGSGRSQQLPLPS